MRVAVVHSAIDSAVASALEEGLRGSGIERVTVDEAPTGIVVLISNEALDDPAWSAAVERVSTHRVVPVRVHALEEERVPSRLRELNWIDWVDERPATTIGFVLAGLFSDPGMHQLAQHLIDQAEAWDRAGRPKQMLVTDRGRARQMVELMERLADDPMASLSATAIAFVEASNAVSRKRRRRRLLARGGAGFAVLAAISAATTVIPSLQAFSRISQASIINAGDQAILDDMPEWSAGNGALLVIHGTPTQRKLGKATLIQAMSRPWPIGHVSYIDSVRSLIPYANGTKSAVIALTADGSAYGDVDVLQGQTIGFLPLPGRKFEEIDISADGRYVAFAGEGAGVMPFRTHSFHPVTSEGQYAGVRASGPNLVLWTEAGELETRAVAGGASHPVGSFEKVLEVLPDGSGGGAALVTVSPGQHRIVDVASGAILAAASVPAGEGVGTLAPDRRRAVVDGGDGQFWTFGADWPPRPTGIAVPISPQDLEWASDERLVVGSDSHLGEVFHLPRGQLLGRLCAGAPSVSEMRLEPGGEVVACGGDARSIWRLPAAPGSSPPERAASLHETIRSPYGQVEIRGRRMRVSLRGRFGSASAPPVEPFASEITAAAFSPTDHQFAIGSARGGVIVVGLTRHGTRSVVLWKAPDAAAISKLRWNRGFIAQTTSGQSWALPSCPGCETTPGLLAEARRRFTGCFSDRQMTWFDSETRATLGLNECEPLRPLEDD